MNTRLEVFDKVKELLVEFLGCDIKDIKEETDAIADLGADELDCVEIILDLESAFGFSISDDDTNVFYQPSNPQSFSVGKCVDFICNKLNVPV